MQIYLIRHGKTYGNTLGRYIGRTDEPLLEESFAELKEKEAPQVEGLFVSPMLRCQQTAKALYPLLEGSTVEGLRECDFGLFENKNYQELDGDAQYQAWIDSNATLPFPQGESPEEFKGRSVEAFWQCVARAEEKGYGRIALVVHGGTIMSIMEKLAKPEKGFYEWYVKNGQGYALVCQEQQVQHWETLTLEK